MPVVKSDTMRGLAVFISDIRNCKSKEAEVKRINKELANIRSKFKGDKTLDGYMKKKYVCKLLFIFLLGHDIDFGHMEAVNLLSSNKYTEKQIGYLFISVLISENNELMRLVVQNLKNDISSRNPIHVNLALQCIANIGSREMAETFAPEIPKLLVSGDIMFATPTDTLSSRYAAGMPSQYDTMDTVKQSAALCLLKLLRTAPDSVSFTDWTARVVHLLNDQHMGVVTAATSLIEALVKRNPDEYKGCVSLAVSRLSRIVTSSYTDLQDYTYYFVPAPWLSVKLLRLLQNYPPSEDPTVRSRLTECLESILNKTQEAPKSKKVQHSNAKNAVLFEAINLIIHMDSDPQLLVRASNQLGQFLQHRETNLRYLALESMCLLATSEFSHEAVKKNQETVVSALKSERDVSVRQRAVDLLYAMCDKSNAEEIVGEMLVYLETADYSIREEMVLKVAILAEKYASDYTWYVDTILNLIRVAGDYVSEEVWYRVIQIVINRDDVQGYAAKTVFEALQAPACHENMVKVGGYILGEFGNLIAGDTRSSPVVQFQLLHDKFHLCSSSTRQLLLSTYVKFVNLFPEIKNQVADVLLNDANIKSSDVEIQQRAVEYHQLIRLASSDVLATVLEEMPPFPERESSILAKLKQKKPATVDANQRLAASGPGPVSGAATAAATAASKGDSAAVTAAAAAGVTDSMMAGGAGGATLNLTGDVPGGESEVDLLGLGGSEASVPSRPAQSNRDLLVDLLGGGGPQIASAPVPSSNGNLLESGIPSGVPQTGPVTATYGAGGTRSLSGEENLPKFVLKNSGVVFENDLIQVGMKAEYRQNLGRLGFFYGNKTSNRLTGVVAELRYPSPEMADQLLLQMKPIDTVIEAGNQSQQLVNVECLGDFSTTPQIAISFTYAGSTPQSHVLPLPVFLNKFIQSTEMDASVFFQRWKQLPQDQECQRVFRAKTPIDASVVKTKFAGFGFSLLEGVDPNPSNLVGAGVVHTRGTQVGVLARLELNMQAQAYRLTLRSTREAVSRILAELLEAQL